MAQAATFKFRLYVADKLPSSARARQHLVALCQQHAEDRYEIELVDIFQAPQRARADGVTMAPTLIKLQPLPEQRIIGTLGQAPWTAQALGLLQGGGPLLAAQPAEPSSPPGEIDALIETLLATEARLDVSMRGEVDTVTNHTGQLLMTRRAQEHMRRTHVDHHADRSFSDLLENVELAAVMLDREARITYCNPFLLHLTGWREDEVLGQDWFALFMPAELGDMKPVFAALLTDAPQAWHVEQQIYTRTRERRLLRWNNSVLRSATGVVIGTASIGVDVTEQTLANLRIQRQNQAYAMLSGINSLQVRVRDRAELLREACRIAVDEGRFRMAWVALLDLNAGGLTLAAEAGVEPALAGQIRDCLATLPHMPAGYAATIRKLEARNAVVLNNLRHVSAYDLGSRHFAAGVRSMVIMPLFVQDALAGVLTLCADEVDYFPEGQLAVLRELAGDIAFAIDHIAKQERLDYLSYYDVLTGLANRSLFLERLAQFLRRTDDTGERLALYMVDVERFKNINDSMGTPAGDAVLRQIAEWLKAAVGDAAVLARVGADRFAIVQPVVGSEEDLEKLISVRSQAFANHVFRVGDAVVWDPLESTCRHASLSIL